MTQPTARAPDASPPEAKHETFDRTSARPTRPHDAFSPVWRQVCRLFLWASGWKAEGDWPDHPKLVVIAAPHTSNWDGPMMLAAAGYYQVKLRWMGKKSLTEGPLGWVVKAAGCVPIDRSARQDVVGQMTQAFREEDRLVLAVPPEGTRGRAEAWKTGFYHIAVAAEAPILMSVLDYGAKAVRISGILWPTGDYEADMRLVATHYEDAEARFPDRFAKPVR